MRSILVNGNEAIAWAALQAGVDFFSHYPGSPVNRVEPALRKLNDEFLSGVTFNDSLNEHIATLAAAGASFAGARSMVVMKHVGLNIAADPLNYIGSTGVKGGMVIVVGTDPGATCSTGEEDVHWFAIQASLPLLEPTNINDIQKHILEAYRISEERELPVLVFVPTRVCYDTDSIDVDDEALRQPRVKKHFAFERNFSRYVNVGAQAVKNHRELLEKLRRLGDERKMIREFFSPEAELCVITRGATLGHTFESVSRLGLADRVHLVNLDLVYPLNRGELKKHLSGKKELIVIEDQDGFLEQQIKMQLFNDLECSVHGKEIFPAYGEITFQAVYEFFRKRFAIAAKSDAGPDPLPAPSPAELAIPERLGTFCEGCPHRSTFFVIDTVIRETVGRDKAVIGGDIGCSSLPPQRADWLMCMNAGIGVSQGMAQVVSEQVIISTGGDGSFFHAGLTSLQSAVQNNINLVHLVLDNRSVAMTGHQVSPTATSHVEWRKLLESIGVEHIYEVDAFSPEDFKHKLKLALKGSGVRVLWVKGDCALLPSEETKRLRERKLMRINPNKCGECRICYTELQCPAINVIDPDYPDLAIDPDRCRRCNVCREICPNESIEVVWKK